MSSLKSGSIRAPPGFRPEPADASGHRHVTSAPSACPRGRRWASHKVRILREVVARNATWFMWGRSNWRGADFMRDALRLVRTNSGTTEKQDTPPPPCRSCDERRSRYAAGVATGMRAGSSMPRRLEMSTTAGSSPSLRSICTASALVEHRVARGEYNLRTGSQLFGGAGRIWCAASGRQCRGSIDQHKSELA
ncbi:hypothetical protein BH20CHL2_BH20CHL2_06480 [soil metagenome]